MSVVSTGAKTVIVTTLLAVTAYGTARVITRARRAWRNMKIIQSVETGSVWTTE